MEQSRLAAWLRASPTEWGMAHEMGTSLAGTSIQAPKWRPGPHLCHSPKPYEYCMMPPATAPTCQGALHSWSPRTRSLADRSWREQCGGKPGRQHISEPFGKGAPTSSSPGPCGVLGAQRTQTLRHALRGWERSQSEIAEGKRTCCTAGFCLQLTTRLRAGITYPPHTRANGGHSPGRIFAALLWVPLH